MRMKAKNDRAGNARYSPSDIGKVGEKIAHNYLEECGYEVVATNWRPHGLLIRGELDLIAIDGQSLVFVEVKTRASLSNGSPFEAITPSKVRTLRRLAHAYLSTMNTYYRELRFDAIAIVLGSGQYSLRLEKIEHLKAVA